MYVKYFQICHRVNWLHSAVKRGYGAFESTCWSHLFLLTFYHWTLYKHIRQDERRFAGVSGLWPVGIHYREMQVIPFTFYRQYEYFELHSFRLAIFYIRFIVVVCLILCEYINPCIVMHGLLWVISPTATKRHNQCPNNLGTWVLTFWRSMLRTWTKETSHMAWS